MSADPSIYGSARLAEAYARHRPAVHPAVAERLRRALVGTEGFDSVLDAGCGAGASTAAMLPHARRVVGLDPFPAMLSYAAAMMPGASFVQGRIESLPFGSGTFQLVTSAGAINYVDPDAALKELSRVLRPGGWLALYDFGAGCRLTHESTLPQRFAQLSASYPPPGGYALDLQALPFAGSALSPISHQAFEFAIPLTAPKYVDYIMSETGIEAAIAAGACSAGIRQTIEQLFTPVFAGGVAEVVFDTVLVIAQRMPSMAS
ncbi:MAG: class I SAM-dependent methyltransferase [Rubrivivax sp.]|nr:class I SAM-dependent methyltransferase [Rubrivivax sp.]